MAASFVPRLQTRLPCRSSLRSRVSTTFIRAAKRKEAAGNSGNKDPEMHSENGLEQCFREQWLSHSSLDRCGFHGSRSTPSLSWASFQALSNHLRSTPSFRQQRFSADVPPGSESQTVWSYTTVSSANGSFITILLWANSLSKSSDRPNTQTLSFLEDHDRL